LGPALVPTDTRASASGSADGDDDSGNAESALQLLAPEDLRKLAAARVPTGDERALPLLCALHGAGRVPPVVAAQLLAYLDAAAYGYDLAVDLSDASAVTASAAVAAELAATGADAAPAGLTAEAAETARAARATARAAAADIRRAKATAAASRAH
jgi:hypothetical protein